MTTIALCDPNLLIRGGLRAILAGEPDIEVVAEVADGEQALRTVRRLRPDLLFTALDLPGGHGFEVARALARAPETRSTGVVFLAQSFDPALAVQGLMAGGRAFVSTGDPPRRLVTAARAVAAGYAVLPPAVLADGPWLTGSGGAARPGAAPGVPGLTGRELEVLRLMAAGMSNAEIAGHLSLGEATVKSHVSRLLGKLGLRNRSQAIACAYRTGLVTVPVPGRG
ncbi:putative DNA binding regulatory protein [Streptantibioticus cattleyicolor NRRL 8057 = DSM 46488]|uniref:Putative DNA binding regulatory protein n=1 Tax=Streptantibioticus cattleyicolor (strain ATCC 35852 / DSM 46488 / JCM 4925 / NBRC 14057 / NRRL 8057) TaxID=1003195 RepID=G8X0C3_STREN|nr:putative DNA binding regulatory protein [Streptantibioticus cattleyicolor NRRL 8057 = DSM 46488]